MRVLDEKKWSSEVDTKWKPREGLFSDGTAEQIANSASRGHDGDKGSAIKALNFYINRGGKNISAARKSVIKKAIEILQGKMKKESSLKKIIIQESTVVGNIMLELGDTIYIQI